MSQPQTTSWSLTQKIGFRFIVVYLFLFIFSFPIREGYLDVIIDFYTELWHQLVPWVGEHILHLENKITIFSRGGMDTTYNYVQILIFFVLSIITVIVWTLLDRKRKNYQTFLKWFLLWVVYYLAFYIFLYGFDKVIPIQFLPPSLLKLLQPFGDASPMGLAWTFMGASKTYMMFSGWIEVIGGFLLLYKRTRTLGALVTFGAMLNVFLMNMSYDIPVKLLSFHLMMIALFFLLLDNKRLIHFFVLNKQVAAKSLPIYFKNRKYNTTFRIFQLLFIGYMLIAIINNKMEFLRMNNNSSKPILYGIHNVETFTINKDTIPPLMTDTIRWKKIIFDKGFWSDYTVVIKMDDSREYFNYTIDSVNQNLQFISTRDSTDIRYDFHYIKTDSTSVFYGTQKNKDSLLIQMTPFDLKSFRLTNRGFHWINEYGYNR